MNPSADRRPSRTTWRSRSWSRDRHGMSAGHGTPTGAHAAAPAPVRVVIDEFGVGWRVHEIVSATRPAGRPAVGLIFCCDVPGRIPQLRRVWRRLDHLGDTDLLDVLGPADD